MKALFRIVDGLNLVLRHAVGAMLGVMVLVVALQIVVRFVLPKLGLVVSAAWTEELARYLMVWSIFLGSAVATRSGALIAMDSLPDALPEAAAHLVRTLALLITIAFYGVLFWLGVKWMEFGMAESSTVMALPMAWVYAALPVGAALSILNLVVLLIERRHARRRRHEGLDVEASASIV